MTDIETRLQRLEDKMEIQQLFIDYGQHLDAGRWSDYAKLFALEGEINLGPMGKAKGRDNIGNLLESILGEHVGETYHIISSPMVSINGDTASSEVMWSVLSREPDGTPNLSATGRHIDTLVREDGAWRFQSRRGLVDLPSVMK